MRSLRVAVLAVALLTISALAQTPQPRALSHPDTVYDVAFSPDGKTLATACFDKSVRLWDVASGKEIRTIAGKAGHQNLVVHVAYSADGSQLVSTSTDNTAKVWDIPTGTPTEEWKHPQGVTQVAVSPDGKTFAAVPGMTPMQLWNAADKKKVTPLGAHNGGVVGFQYSANGANISSLGSSTDRNLKYWTTADGKLLGSIGVGGTPNALWVNPGNSVPVTATAEGNLIAWPATLPAAPKPFVAPTGKPRTAVLSADGSQLYLVLQDQALSVRAWATATGQVKPVVETLPAGNVTIAAHPSNGSLAVLGGDGKVQFFGADGKPTGVLPLNKSVQVIALHPGEAKLVTANLQGEVQTWALPKANEKEPKEPKPLSTRPTTAQAVRVALIPQTNQAVTIDQNSEVAVWDTTDGKEPKLVRKLGTVGKQPNALAISKDGQMVAASGQKVLKVWTIADGKEIPVAAQATDVLALAFSADKTRLAVSNSQNAAVVYSLASGQPEQFVQHTGAVLGLAFHPTQPLLFTAGEDKVISATPLLATKLVADPVRFGKLLKGLLNGASLLTAGTGEGLFRVNASSFATEATYGKSKDLSAAAANKQNTQIATAEGDGTITIYNTNNAAESQTFKAPARVLELVFHPTLPQVAGVLADGRVMTWITLFDPAETKPEEKRFGAMLQEVPHAKATSAAYTPDGATLLTGGLDLAMRSWKVIGETARFSFGHPNIVNAAAFDKAGTRLATGGQDGIVRIYDLTKPAGTAPKTINAHVPMAPAQPQPIYVVLFSTDDKNVISCGFDKSIKIHDATSGALVKEIKPGADKVKGHTDAIYALALSPDGKTLASGSADRTVILWNAITGEFIREFKNSLDAKLKDVAHPGYVQGLRYSPDGSQVITVGMAPKNKGYVAVWNVSDGKQVSGQELDYGPIHAVDVRKDGTIVLGCAAQMRNQSNANAILLTLPK